MTSFLLALISQHTDRLKCEPPLATPFHHCSFSNHVPQKNQFFVCTKNYNIVTNFGSIVACKHPKTKIMPRPSLWEACELGKFMIAAKVACGCPILLTMAYAG
jgi:hypothetical protein